MITCIKYFIAIQRRVLAKVTGFKYPNPRTLRENDECTVVNLINEQLCGDKPCMICRFGAFELSIACNYRTITEKHFLFRSLTSIQVPPPFWSEGQVQRFKMNAGFFNVSEDNLTKYSQLFLFDLQQIDLLASWCAQEYMMEDKLKHVKKIAFEWLEPWFSSTPWSKNLEGKNVLVIHPFSELIESQYNNKRNLLFENPDVLPKFNLIVLKAVQSIGGESNGFKDWFEALKFMEEKMDSINYDIALVGCGAYGMHLAAHAKRRGKKAIHMGGSLQLLFGIRGKRWDNPKQGADFFGRDGVYTELFNDYWVYPGEEYRPKKANLVEGATYWEP